MNNPMNDLWKAQQDAATRFTDSWRTLLPTADDSTARSSRPPESDDRPAEIVENVGNTTAVEPAHEVIEPEPEAPDFFRAIQALGDGQRDFADHMTRWAEQQRELADSMTVWADRQRECADALNRVLAPFSSGTGGRPS